MPQPSGHYYGPPLEKFNDPKAPSIAALTGPERQRLIDAIKDGAWASATMTEQSIMLKRTPVLAAALQWQHQESLITPAGKLVAELLAESRDARVEREARESAENRRVQLREMGYPATMDEARADKSGLLALTSTQSLSAKSLFFKLPEYQQMTELATNYAAHLEKLRGDAQSALDKATAQLDAITRRGEEINALLAPQPPTDPAPEQ